MLKVSQYDEHTLQTLTPEDIKARLTLEPGVELDMQATSLKLALQLTQGEQAFDFPLQRESTEAFVESGGIFGADVLWERTVLALSPAGKAAFQQMQTSFAQESPRGLGLSINVDFVNKTQNQGTMTIELQMYEKEGFFTLFDKYQWQKGKRERF